MKKNFQLLLLLSLTLISSTVRFVSADTISHQKYQSDQEELGESDQQLFELSLFDIGFEEPVILHGPYQEISTVFAFPMDWEIVSDAKIELKDKKLRLVATDARRLALMDYEVDSKEDIEEVIIPYKVLSEVQKILAKTIVDMGLLC